MLENIFQLTGPLKGLTLILTSDKELYVNTLHIMYINITLISVPELAHVTISRTSSAQLSQRKLRIAQISFVWLWIQYSLN